MTGKFQISDWKVETIPDDGGRISRLSYKGNELLCQAPAVFRTPVNDYGLYETRPVYGYDDCFPSVDKCKFPCAPEFDVPDHGLLCWRKWNVKRNEDILTFKTASSELPVEFRRILEFSGGILNWNFEISNHGPSPVPFLHVMHPLMPLHMVKGLRVPEFSSVFDEVNQKEMSLTDAYALEEYLLNLKRGEFSMLILRGVKGGRISIDFKSHLSLDILFPEKQFPSVGIWWNNSGYPAEGGLERCEFAVEPIPGICSSLERCFNDGKYLSVLPGSILSWNVRWKIV